MNLQRLSRLLVASLLLISAGAFSARAQNGYARDPNQTIDDEYTKKIREYTTEPFFNSPLTDYLPASPNVPTPKAVLGDVAGAPGKLPYAEEVYRYMRLLEKASSRVKVFSIGTTEEGREMIAVAIASESLLAKLDDNRARLAKLADPRLIKMDDAEADRLVEQSFPIYYITGTIHSPETGAPTALMELAYRLAVDDSPYIKSIRDGMLTLITPVVEVDGRDRMCDIYNWHLAHPGQNWPGLIYWGHYVAHDNNRDAMGLSLKLTRNVLNTYVGWKAQVLHDLHESVPYLYDNTVGDGPYNAWLDPILTDEWQMIGWKNVSEMTKFGMPGVFAHGTFDTWSPGYLMFIAATHNGISRLYETFGNAGADTLVRTLSENETSRTWYRQNPPPAASPAAATATPSDAVPRASSTASPSSSPAAAAKPAETETRTFPAGSYIVRMDQPYSRIADALLDYQYWSPKDPQQDVYDDTGWTFGELGNVQVVRVTDVKVLDAAMEPVNGEVKANGGLATSAPTVVVGPV